MSAHLRLSLLIALSLVACPPPASEPADNTPPDSGSASTTQMDASTVSAEDSGTSHNDGGFNGNPMDAGLPLDAGTFPDAGRPVDAGVVLPGDAGIKDFMQFCAQLKAEQCERYVRCGEFYNRDECLASTYSKAYTEASCLAELYGAGAARFDAAAAEQCLVAEKNAGCTRFQENLIPACRRERVFQPTTSLGGECFSSLECKSSEFCSAELRMACPGTCKARTPIGQAPGESGKCATDAYLEPTTQTCVAKLPLGSLCPSDVPPSLSCDNATCYGGTCLRLETSVAEGGLCAGGRYASNCALGVDCVNGACVRRLLKGSTCDDANTSPLCQQGLVCFEGKCTETLTENQPCAIQGQSCRRGLALYCRAEPNRIAVCATYQAPGQPCGSPLFCDPLASYCDASSTCRPRGRRGDACSSQTRVTSQCEQGLECVDKICVPRECTP
jgi:hypothetical protein